MGTVSYTLKRLLSSAEISLDDQYAVMRVKDFKHMLAALGAEVLRYDGETLTVVYEGDIITVNMNIQDWYERG